MAGDEEIKADAILIATGAMPRVLPGAEPDGERILTWRQLYDLTELPPDLIVVGSGVTGAEFASAYQALGSRVTLVSSRDRVLPQEDEDAANLIEDVFRRSGMTVLGQSRAKAVPRDRDGVTVTLTDGRTVTGSHCLMTVGMVPRTEGCGLDAAGVKVDEHGFIEVDRVSRTSVPGVYAAGDCTGVLMLASVAAMQGRIAMWHALGESVHPIRLGHVAATIFTDPEIATVGVSQRAVDAGEVGGPHPEAAAGHQPAGQDGRLPRRLRQAVHQPGHRRDPGRRDRGPAGQRADPGRLGRHGAAPDRRAAGPDVRRLPVPVRQRHRGRPQAHGVHARHP